MKKIVALLLVVTILLGIGSYLVVSSPEFMLRRLSQEIAQNGFSAVEPHLTRELQQIYQSVMALVNQPWLAELLSNESTQALIAMMRSESALTWKLADIRKGHSTASVLVDVDSTAFDAQLSLEMIRQDGKWLISSFTLPSFALN